MSVSTLVLPKRGFDKVIEKERKEKECKYVVRV